MRILLTGASGQLGAYLIDRLVEVGHELIAWSGTEPGQRRGVVLTPLDLTDGESTRRSLDLADPDAVIHAAAISSADAVRLDPVRASAINIDATRRIVEWCDRHDRRLVFTSTDLVFDGSRPWNREDDPAEPILAYGRTKRLAESAVLGTQKGSSPDSACCSARRGADAPTSSLRPSRPGEPASLGRFSRTNIGPRSTWRRPPRSWSGWPRASWRGSIMSPDVSE